MASSFRLPNHEQDEARIKLYDLAQPHEPTAYEKQSMMEVEEALATFKTEDKYHKLMLKKAETLPPIVQLVRACKMREDSLQAHHAEQVQQLLQEKEAELTTKHTTELKEAQDKHQEQLLKETRALEQRETNLITVHAGELRSIQSALTAAAASRGIFLLAEAESPAIDRLNAYITASGTSSKQSEASQQNETRRVEGLYQASDDRVREHMRKTLVDMKMPPASGDALEAYTVSFVNQMLGIYRDLTAHRIASIRINRDVTDALRTHMGKTFRPKASCETNVSIFVGLLPGLVRETTERTHSDVMKSIHDAFDDVCNKTNIHVPSSASPEDFIQQLGAAFDTLIGSCNSIWQDVATTVNVTTARLDMDLALLQDDSIDVMVKEFAKRMRDQLEHSHEERDEAVRKLSGLDEWLKTIVQSLRVSSQSLGLSIEEGLEDREFLTTYLANLRMSFSKQSAIHKAVGKQMNDTSASLGIDISSKSGSLLNDRMKLFVTLVTDRVQGNNKKADDRLSKLVELMRPALDTKATVPADNTPEALFAAYHKYASEAIRLLSSERQNIEGAVDQATLKFGFQASLEKQVDRKVARFIETTTTTIDGCKAKISGVEKAAASAYQKLGRRPDASASLESQVSLFGEQMLSVTSQTEARMTAIDTVISKGASDNNVVLTATATAGRLNELLRKIKDNTGAQTRLYTNLERDIHDAINATARTLEVDIVQDVTVPKRLEALVVEVNKDRDIQDQAAKTRIVSLTGLVRSYRSEVLHNVAISDTFGKAALPAWDDHEQIERFFRTEREQFCTALKKWKGEFQQERRSVVRAYDIMFRDIWKVSFPNRAPMPAVQPDSTLKIIELWTQGQSSAYQSASAQSQQTDSAMISEQQEVSKDMFNMTDAFIRDVFALHCFALEKWPSHNENEPIKTKDYQERLDGLYSELKKVVVASEKANSEGMTTMKNAAVDALNHIIENSMGQQRSPWQLQEDDFGNFGTWAETQQQAIANYIGTTAAASKKATTALGDVIKGVSAAFTSIYDATESGLKKPEWPKLSPESPDVAIMFFKGLPNDITLQLTTQKLEATRDTSTLQQAHTDLDSVMASASDLVQNLERKLSLEESPRLQREDGMIATRAWFGSKGIIFQDRIAQDAKLHDESLQKLLNCVEDFVVSALQQAGRRTFTTRKPTLESSQDWVAEHSKTLEEALTEQRSVDDKKISRLLNHVARVTTRLSKMAVDEIPASTSVRSDWSSEQLTAHCSTIEAWLQQKLSLVQEKQASQLHEKYGDCIVEFITSVFKDTFSFQGLVYPEEDVPALELRPDQSLEAALANAHAAKTWVSACAATIGKALTARKAQKKQFVAEFNRGIIDQRSLLHDCEVLKGDVQDSMDLANDLYVQVNRLTGA